MIDVLSKFINSLKDKNYLISLLNVMMILFTLNLLNRNFGISAPLSNRLFASYILIGIIILNFSFKKLYNRIKKNTKSNINKRIILGVILILFSFCVLLTSFRIILWLISIPIFILGLDITLREIFVEKKELFILFLTSFSFSLLIIFTNNIPPLFYILQNFSLIFSKSVGYIVIQPNPIGPTLSGLWIIIIFLLFSFSIYLSSDKRKKLNFLFCILGLIIIWIAFLIIKPYSFGLELYSLNLYYILFILCLIPVIFLISKTKIKNIFIFLNEHNKMLLILKFKKTITLAIILMFLFGLFLNLYPLSISSPQDNGEEKILFYGKNMLGDWNVPKYGLYDEKHASGMFGLLPVYLDTFGYKSSIFVDNKTSFVNETRSSYTNSTSHTDIINYLEILEGENLTSDILYDVDVFVITNIRESFSSTENQVIWNFVRDGGSLLVLGDHTDINGIMNPLNELLKPVDIGFRFDSAISMKDNWIYCLDFMEHPINSGVKDSTDLIISVGASLDISSTSIPIVKGKYSFQDIGDRLNSISYLGDYKINSDEQVGDLILVAGTYYGKGKVLVFGDTTPFQNPAFPYSHSFINNVFIWLNTEETSIYYFLQIIASLSVIIGILILIYINKNIKNLLYILFSIVLCLSIIFSTFINTIFVEQEEISGPIAYIDVSHGERINLQLYDEKGVDGLMRNIARNDYIPMILRDFSTNKIANCEILIFIAPTMTINNNEINILKKFMSRGGLIIFSTGFEDKTSSEKLLSEFGFDIIDNPLGPVPYAENEPEKYQYEPRFVDSWPIIIGKENFVDIFYSTEIENNTYNIIAFKEYRQGGFLLISDSQFLLNNNLESRNIQWPGNVIFFKNIFDELNVRGIL